VISSNYLFILPILVAAYLWLKSQPVRLLIVAIAGGVTLLTAGWVDFLIIGILILLTWYGVQVIEIKYRQNRLALGLLIALQVMPLVFYKVLKTGLWGLLGDGWVESHGMSAWLPPLGISVLTFQAVSYTIDRLKREIESHSILHFAVYMTFFPHLAAGPILKASDFVNQLLEFKKVQLIDIHEGLWRIFQGLIKKLIFSDVIARACVDPVFSDSGSFSSLEIAIALLAYTMQIYLDFSGYTDVVIGSGRLMGFKLPENFNRPYHATSIAEYWRRWHMSLSTWVNFYVYRPLGGSRVDRWKIYRNVLISIILLAVWHGLSFNFLIYGMIHGSAVCFNRWLRWQKRWTQWVEQNPVISAVACWIITFSFVVLARILFRTPNLEEAWNLTENLFNSELSGSPRFSVFFWISFLMGMVTYFAPEHYGQKAELLFVKAKPWMQGVAFAIVLILAGYLSGGQALNFIYRTF
jgi:D-alanyl-lipoteichoic acid acyltransferase DltB (MBOAT superfamily)